MILYGCKTWFDQRVGSVLGNRRDSPLERIGMHDQPGVQEGVFSVVHRQSDWHRIPPIKAQSAGSRVDQGPAVYDMIVTVPCGSPFALRHNPMLPCVSAPAGGCTQRTVTHGDAVRPTRKEHPTTRKRSETISVAGSALGWAGYPTTTPRCGHRATVRGVKGRACGGTGRGRSNSLSLRSVWPSGSTRPSAPDHPKWCIWNF